MKTSHTIVGLPTSINPNWKIGIIASAFYKEEMEQLTQGAVETLTQAGIQPENIVLQQAAGSFEVPLLGAAFAKDKKVDALIGLGIIIEGETHHARLLAEQATRGIMNVQLQYVLPFAFEILYVDSIEIARQRLHKGQEAAISVLHSLAALQQMGAENL